MFNTAATFLSYLGTTFAVRAAAIAIWHDLLQFPPLFPPAGRDVGHRDLDAADQLVGRLVRPRRAAAAAALRGAAGFGGGRGQRLHDELSESPGVLDLSDPFEFLPEFLVGQKVPDVDMKDLLLGTRSRRDFQDEVFLPRWIQRFDFAPSVVAFRRSEKERDGGSCF